MTTEAIKDNVQIPGISLASILSAFFATVLGTMLVMMFMIAFGATLLAVPLRFMVVGQLPFLAIAIGLVGVGLMGLGLAIGIMHDELKNLPEWRVMLPIGIALAIGILFGAWITGEIITANYQLALYKATVFGK